MAEQALQLYPKAVIIKIEELANLPDYHPFEFHIVDEKGFRRYVEVLKVSPIKIEELL